MFNALAALPSVPTAVLVLLALRPCTRHAALLAGLVTALLTTRGEQRVRLFTAFAQATEPRRGPSRGALPAPWRPGRGERPRQR